MQIGKLPRVKLVNLPTPLEEMPRLSKVLGGPRLWIKRDDYTGLAFGGNKARKMEFVMADAISKKADVVITTGDAQSNHARVTTAAAAKLGMKTILILHEEKPKEYDGNLLLDDILGADIRFIHAEMGEISSIMKEIAKELENEGYAPYIIPSGASYPMGSVGYVNASLELLIQANEMGIEVNYIVHAVGSGGTQAGLVLGNKALKTKIKVLGISVGPSKVSLARHTATIADGTSKLLGLDTSVTPNEVMIIDDYVEEGHGVLTQGVIDAIKLVAKTEGILLDPVYTGKAMMGLMDLLKRGYFNEKEHIVFVHTGGTPAIFAYKNEFKT